MEGLEQFSQVIRLNRPRSAGNKRSNVATYSGAYDQLRALFAASPGAKAAGLQAKHFSFNLPGAGAKPARAGHSRKQPAVFPGGTGPLPCLRRQSFPPGCPGRALPGSFYPEVLALPLADALPVFLASPAAPHPAAFVRCGAWLPGIGQPSPPFRAARHSGSLASELIAGGGGRTSICWTNSTAGLHPQDVEHFLTFAGPHGGRRPHRDRGGA